MSRAKQLDPLAVNFRLCIKKKCNHKQIQVIYLHCLKYTNTVVIQILTGLTNWHDFHKSVWSPKHPWLSNWGRIRWKFLPRKLPMSSLTDDNGTRWPDQLPRCITKATSVLEYFIKGEITEHQIKTLICFHSFNLCKNNQYLQQMIYHFQNTIWAIRTKTCINFLRIRV